MNLVVIPARYGSKRLPGKPLIELFGKPIIQHVYERASLSKKKDRVIIATDDLRIKEVCETFGAEVVLTREDIQSGTERVYEVVKNVDADIVINLQGDEPFIDPDLIDKLFEHMEKSRDYVATLCTEIKHEEEFKDPNCVKVVLDKDSYALYFSRSPIPYLRNRGSTRLYKHIGIYAFRRDFLKRYVEMEKGILEETESLEQLRILENGLRIKVLTVDYSGFGIDTEEDLRKAKERFGHSGCSCEPKPL